jgi:hypothetical protein
MLQEQVDPDLLPRAAQRHEEDQVALLLLEVGGDEAAVLAAGAAEVQHLGEGGLQDLEELAQLPRVLEQPQRAAVRKLPHGQQREVTSRRARRIGIGCGHGQLSGS